MDVHRIKSHEHHPWNELADRLCLFASEGCLSTVIPTSHVHHIKAHELHPWNELADRLCLFASEGCLSTVIPTSPPIANVSACPALAEAAATTCRDQTAYPAPVGAGCFRYFNRGCVYLVPAALLAEKLDEQIEQKTNETDDPP